MKPFFNRRAACLMIAAGIASITPAQAQQSHADDHANHGAGQVELQGGKQWATDAPLRETMERIHSAVGAARLAESHGGMNAGQAAVLGTAIEQDIGFMVQHCRLEPKADADLHVLLARLSAAATAVKANPKAKDGLPQMQEVLDIYGRRFSHPGWDTLALGH